MLEEATASIRKKVKPEDKKSTIGQSLICYVKQRIGKQRLLGFNYKKKSPKTFFWSKANL